MFIDAHAHLDERYFDLPPEEIVHRAREAGVDQLVVVGCGLEASRHAVALAKAAPGILFAAVGVHPHDVEEMTDADFEALAELAKEDVVVGVGETGLDYYYDHSPRDAQREAFRRFCRLAKDLNKTLVVHTREAEADTVEILQDEGPFPAGGQIHCFTGTRALSAPAVEMGFHVSFSGVVTFNNADELRSIAAELPLDRILIETDCPYLTPAPFRGRKNEPMFVTTVAARIAEEKGLTVDEVAEATSQNARGLFGLPEAPSTERIVFTAGKVLHVETSADPEAVLEAAKRVPTKKVKQIVLRGPEDTAAAEAVKAWAKEIGRPVVEA